MKNIFVNFADFWRKSVRRGPKHSDNRSRKFLGLQFQKSRDLADVKSLDPGILLGPGYLVNDSRICGTNFWRDLMCIYNVPGKKLGDITRI